MKFTVLILAAALFIAGCTTAPPAAPAPVIGSITDYGDYPTNADHLVNVWISVYLNDPEMVKDLKIWNPQKFFLSYCLENGMGYLAGHSLARDTQFYGYMISFTCISKNQFGAFGREELHSFFERNGDIIETMP